ncbi:MAG: hypothetical protein H0V30_00420 [Chitinophagaceae bacterium]|jgi:hypothetical protein|nr:hypothetical protein [Chitinophagaceae bacterium]
MKFQVGDTVRIIHSNEEGQVIDIINEKMVMVDVDGVKFPVYADQVEFPYFKRFSDKRTADIKQPAKKYIEDVRKEKREEKTREENGVWLTFLPVMELDEFGDEVVELLKLHLVNHTSSGYRFIYNLNFFGRSDFELRGDVQSFADFYLHDVPFENMNDNPSFDFEFSLINPDKKKADYYEYSLKLKPKQLFGKIETLRKKNEATFSFLLFDKYPPRSVEDDYSFDLLSSKYKVYDASKKRVPAEPARSMVDLHIEKLSDDWKHQTNFEILSIQLKTFEKYYELAIQHYQPNLVVVHGIGSGKLRDEIHEILRLKKEVKSFVNQYHPLYGYGATEIYFQYL